MSKHRDKQKPEDPFNLEEYPHDAPWKGDKGDQAAHDVLDPDVPGDVIEVDVTDVPELGPIVSERAAVLREAEELIDGDRNHTYGEPTENFSNIAAVWNVQFGHMLKDGYQFTPAHVAQAQIGTKLCRLIAQPKRDNYVDIAGYAACGWETER